MPELPEVETVVRELDAVLPEKIIDDVEVLSEKSLLGSWEGLVGKRIKKITRKAKIIIFEFEDWNEKILVHLKMTGQLVWRSEKQNIAGGHPTADWLGELPSKHTRVVISFADKSRLFFNDMRKFGWIKIVGKKQWSEMEDGLPPDVVDTEFSLEYFGKILAVSGRAVKMVIMDQKKMGGVGNIYACDGLFLAGVRPDRKTGELGKGEVRKLYRAIKKVIELGIKHKGATYSDFVSSKGMGGSYQKHFLVYDREGKPCKKCRKKIVKIKLGGRGTYFCGKCQV